jgi:broad specificity phosphatase PhoE
MRHAEVRYFEGVHPEQVVLTERGRVQAESAAAELSDVAFDRVVTSGLERTLETARIVAPGRDPESRYALREIESGDIRDVAPDEVQTMMTAAFRGVVPLETRFLDGETIGALLDRVLPELDALLADADWDAALLVLHGAVNRAILSHALTGERAFLGGFEQAPGCINVLDVGADARWIVRAVNHLAYDPAHVAAPRLTTMEHLWQEYLDSRP